MSFKTYTRSTSYYSDGTNEFPLPYGNIDATYDEPLLEIQGKKAVLSFLQHDDDSYHLNPIEEGTANGNIYLARERNCIWTDEAQVKRELCVGGRWDDTPDIDVEVIGFGGKTCRDLAIDLYMSESPLITLIDDWMQAEGFEFDDGETYDSCFKTNNKDIRDWLYDHDAIEEKARDIFAGNWEAIVGPFVIPVSYFSHYDTTISVSSWDGDVDDLPDGVWVADENAVENIVWDYIDRNKGETKPMRLAYQSLRVVNGKNFKGEPYSYTTWKPYYQVLDRSGKPIGEATTLPFAVERMLANYPELLPEIRKASEKYCEAVLQEVSAWASGDVWGCITVSYENVGSDDEPEWEEAEHETCWGYIGLEWAREQIASDFECTKKHVFGV